MIGLVAALATFFGIWLGHVGVRKIEAASPTIWLPTLIALGLGLALEIGSLITGSLYLSGALGILGITVLWDALEITRQHNRVKRGHAPANPRNPRHARLLAEGKATTMDWLDREPVGRPVFLTAESADPGAARLKTAFGRQGRWSAEHIRPDSGKSPESRF